jgi:hypothetical protein
VNSSGAKLFEEEIEEEDEDGYVCAGGSIRRDATL